MKIAYLLTLSLWFCVLSPNAFADGAKPFTRTIDIRLEQGLMFTDVTINGEVYNFLIDTGAPFVFSPELAEKVGFTPREVLAVGSSNTRTGSAKAGTYRGNVELAGLKFSNFKALVMDYNENTQIIRCLGFDGIIGANFMEGAVWQIDYDNQKITITNQPRQLPKIKESWSIRMEKKGYNKSPYIGVRVNKGKAGRVLFDSGFAGFFDLPYTVYSQALKEGRIDESIQIREGRGLMSEGVMGAEDTTGYYMQVPRLFIGKEQIDEPDFVMSHTRQTKVGVEYLKGRLVTLDFPRKRFYVYEKGQKYIPQDRMSFLFSSSSIDGKLVVSAIYPGETEGLNIGDQILEVNGEKVKEMAECDAIFFMRKALKEEQILNMKVRRDDKEFNFKIIKSLIFSD